MTTDTDVAARIRVQIVHALPETYWATRVLLPLVATVSDALAVAGPEISAAGISVDVECLAVFGRAVDPRTRLRDGDRIELLRPLLVSPRDARTTRASLLHVRRIKRAAPGLRVGVVILQMPADLAKISGSLRHLVTVAPEKLAEAQEIGADFAVTSIEAAMEAVWQRGPAKAVAQPSQQVERIIARRRVKTVA